MKLWRIERENLIAANALADVIIGEIKKERKKEKLLRVSINSSV